MSAPLPPPLLTQQQLQEHYGVSGWTVNKWVRQGCPIERLPSGTRRFDLAAVKDWMAGLAEDAVRASAQKSAYALSRRAA